MTLLVEDGNGVGRPVAFAVMTRDDPTLVEQFMNFFLEHNSMQMTDVVVTVKAVVEMNIVRKCWPNCRSLICHFHIMSSLDQYVSSCEFSEFSSDDRKLCSEVRDWFIFVVLSLYHLFYLCLHGVVLARWSQSTQLLYTGDGYYLDG